MEKSTLQRYIEGNSSQQEKEDIAKWLDADEKNMEEFLQLRTFYDITIWNKYQESEDVFNIPFKKRIRTKKIILEFSKIAAIFLVAFCSYYFLIPQKKQLEDLTLAAQSIYVPEGQRSEVVLSDGTKVWLNARSSLTFPKHFKDTARIVELSGEAYFDVTHDEARKFIVKTKDYNIKVLGTEFNVIAYAEKNIFETSLIQGSVEVSSKLSEDRIILTPNERVYLTNDGKLATTEIVNYDQFLWKKGIMALENEPVKDILEKLEYYYDVKITMKNNEILTSRYTGKFWIKDGVEQVLRVLQLRHKFNYTIDEMNNITIY